MLEPVPTYYIDTNIFPVLKSVIEENQKTKVIEGYNLLKFLEDSNKLNEEEKNLINFLEEGTEDYTFVIEVL